MKKISALLLCFMVFSGCSVANENITSTNMSKNDLNTKTSYVTSNVFSSTKAKDETTTTNNKAKETEITRIENYSWEINHVLYSKNEKDFIAIVEKIKNLDSLAILLGCEKEEISKKYRFNKENFDMILKDKCFYILKGQNIKYYDLSDSEFSFVIDEGKCVYVYTKKTQHPFDELAFTSSKYGEVYYESKAYYFRHDGYLVKLSGYRNSKKAKEIINSFELEKHFIK